MISLYIVNFSRGSSTPDFAVIFAESTSHARNIAEDDVIQFWGKGVEVTSIEEYRNIDDTGLIKLATQCC